MLEQVAEQIPWPEPGKPEQFIHGRTVQVSHMPEGCSGWVLDHWLVLWRVGPDNSRQRSDRTPDPQFAPCHACRPGRRAQWDAGYRTVEGSMDDKHIGPTRARAFVLFVDAEEAAGLPISDTHRDWYDKAQGVLRRRPEYEQPRQPDDRRFN